jgi:hypothetical protein
VPEERAESDREHTDAIARFHEYREWLTPTPTAREDFRRTEIDGLTRAERAEERGVEPATVSANVRTAKDRLRAIAEDRGEPDIVTDGVETGDSPTDDAENQEPASSTSTCHGDHPETTQPTESTQPEGSYRTCGCGERFDDAFEYSIHRTEYHEEPQGVLGYLDAGEFETVVEAADSIQEIARAVDWSTERVLRALNIYGLEEIVGPSDVELSDITDVDVIQAVDPATSPTQTDDVDADGEESPATPGEDPRESDGELLRFEDYSAEDGSVKSWECQNCGSHVDHQFVRVFEPENETAPRCCPNCEDLIRDGNSVRKKRA